LAVYLPLGQPVNMRARFTVARVCES